MDSDLSEVLKAWTQQVNGHLLTEVGAIAMSPAMRELVDYTLSAQGKRIRPVVLLWCCDLVGTGVLPQAHVAAVAMEMVHTYSLVHDDLPAMDNDDLRRGRPTCHRAFDEAAAILAGDALLTAAFELLVRRIENPAMAVRLVVELAGAAGPDGMIAGQLADIRAEAAGGDLGVLQYIHTRKTARMFQAAARMGGICGGAGQDQIDRLGEYGLKIGLGFQIADDMLDQSASSNQLGKTAGKDQKAGKLTYPAIVGMDEARRLADELAGQAVEALEPFGNRAWLLTQLALTLPGRKR